MPIETLGIGHVHLLVSDHSRSVSFYQQVFGMEVSFRDGAISALHSPGGKDDFAFHQAQTDDESGRVGHQGGSEHFGITVTDRNRLDDAMALAIQAGGQLVNKGEHALGIPFASIRDPDGYVIEI